MTGIYPGADGSTQASKAVALNAMAHFRRATSIETISLRQAVEGSTGADRSPTMSQWGFVPRAYVDGALHIAPHGVLVAVGRACETAMRN
jgi:hypothetical protein